MNNTRISFAWTACILLASMCVASRAFAAKVIAGENSLNVDGRFQVLGVFESLDNHGWKDDERLYLFMKQARLNFNGEYKECDYALQLMFGGEEIPKANSVMSLLDAYFNVPFIPETFEVKIGQFKVPYGRERLQDSGFLYNTDRSIHNNFFNIGRDVGAAAHTRHGVLTAAAGVFTGGGMDVPQRYIPEDLGFPLIVARIGVNNGLDKNVFTPYQVEADNNAVQCGVFLNGAYTRDSRVGHSTPLNVKYADKSLMLNSSWNPFISAPNERAEFSQYGGDTAVRIPLSETAALLFSAEVNLADFRNSKGALTTLGGVAGVNLLFTDWEIGLRYSVVKPDSDFAYTETIAATDTTPASKKLHAIPDDRITEITPSVTYYARKFGVKFIADLAIQLDVPLSIESNHGLYNLMLQPDQISYAAKGGIEQQDVYVARVVAQYDF